MMRLILCFFLFIITTSSLLSQGIDYHVHAQSPKLAKYVSKLCGTLAQCNPVEVSNGSSVKTLLEEINDTKISKLVLLSTAYMASMPELSVPDSIQAKLTRLENQYIAEQSSINDNVVGFFSINPLTEFAEQEVNYWLKDGRLRGLKLHFANSNVDLFNTEHIKRLQSLFKLVNKKEITIMVHLRTRNPKYGAEDMNSFIKNILPLNSKSNIIFAHAAGWGGYDDPTDKALEALISAIKTKTIDESRIFLDLTAVYLPNLSDEQKKLFLNRFRSLNIKHWTFGSDWFPYLSSFHPKEYLKSLSDSALNEKDISKVITNALPLNNQF